MSLQESVTVRNAKLDAIETAIGTSPTMKIRTGAQPATCATADSGTVLATLSLPSDWMAAAASGSKALAGVWQDLLADAAGVAGHWRIYDTAGTTCHFQGSCSLPAGGGDLELINTNLAVNQPLSITTFTLTEGNA